MMTCTHALVVTSFWAKTILPSCSIFIRFQLIKRQRFAAIEELQAPFKTSTVADKKSLAQVHCIRGRTFKRGYYIFGKTNEYLKKKHFYIALHRQSKLGHINNTHNLNIYLKRGSRTRDKLRIHLLNRLNYV